MSLELIAKSLLEESEKEAKIVISSAQMNADKIISEAKKAEKEMLGKAITEVNNKLLESKKERIAWANLEKKKIISEAKEKVILALLEDFRDRLSELKKKSQYAMFLRKKIKESLDELSDLEAVVHIAKGDKKHLEALGRNVKILEDLDSVGGAIVSNKKGTILINNTLESVFEFKKTQIRKEIYNSLFGKGD
ncbi:MAG: V-type ATP synthase subunit E family protein [Candidatus Micrarchaeia archaeon]